MVRARAVGPASGLLSSLVQPQSSSVLHSDFQAIGLEEELETSSVSTLRYSWGIRDPEMGAFANSLSSTAGTRASILTRSPVLFLSSILSFGPSVAFSVWGIGSNELLCINILGRWRELKKLFMGCSYINSSMK